MTHLRNNDGITLVEVIATLAILSSLSILIYGVLMNGMNYSKKSNDKVAIQQEMNIVTTTFTKAHESYASYDIVVDQLTTANKITLIGKDAAGAVIKNIELSNEEYVYSLSVNQTGTGNLFSTAAAASIDPSKPLYITIKITNKDQPSQTYEVNTIISRL